MRLAEYWWLNVGQPPIELLACRLRLLYGVTPWEFEAMAKGRHLLTMMRDLKIVGFERRVERESRWQEDL